jgi:hypothetical protein
MKQPAAFRGTYSDWRLVKTRAVVQIIFEVPLADADAAYEILGGMPVHGKERWFGIAALKSTAEEAPRNVPSGSSPSTRPDGTKRMDWRDVQPAAQAGIRCNDATFRAFLTEEYSYRPRDANDPEEAAQFLRSFFGINSRVELGTDHRKRVLWKQLDDQFQAWKALEHA